MELQLDKTLSYIGTLSQYKLPRAYVVITYWVKNFKNYIKRQNLLKIDLKTKQKKCEVEMIKYAA